jgi:hypothetical protein
MGFKLERSFDAIPVGTPPFTRGFRGFYFLSKPLFDGLADIADSNDPSGFPCTGTGDGIVNADDGLCDWWTSRQGQIILQHFREADCTYELRSLLVDFLGLTSAGSYTAPFTDPGTQIDSDAYWIIVPFDPAVGPTSNQAVIVGSHDPSYAGHTLAIPASNCKPNRPFINLPYHTMYRTVDEILCGLEGTDWVPDANGNPSTCNGGIFASPDNGGSGALIVVQTFDNVPDSSSTDNQYITRSALVDFLGLAFAGTEYDLTPGDSYEVVLDPAHTPTVWISPHF